MGLVVVVGVSGVIGESMGVKWRNVFLIKSVEGSGGSGVSGVIEGSGVSDESMGGEMEKCIPN